MADLLRDQLYQKIKSDILLGVHKTGDQLSANQLAERYQTSATPVREALNLLQNEGLVEILPRVGYFVTMVTVKDIQDIFDFRVIIEGAAAELAAQNATEEEIEALGKIPYIYDPNDIESYWEYIGHNQKFHYGVALAAHNKWLARSVSGLLDQMQRLVFLGLVPPDHRDEIINHHPRVVEALKRRDGPKAREIMIEGLQTTRESVLEAVMRGSEMPVHKPAFSVKAPQEILLPNGERDTSDAE